MSTLITFLFTDSPRDLLIIYLAEFGAQQGQFRFINFIQELICSFTMWTVKILFDDRSLPLCGCFDDFAIRFFRGNPQELVVMWWLLFWGDAQPFVICVERHAKDLKSKY
ncbi:hypothetical protein [Gimesia chilikensis]|uniref:hypothetical protein n=1 Tax=Gimesia chilikensis TaxID=2605989 RepID=UPI0011A66BE0|nr:hypothetical protein [Gimesia chilikensis]